MTDPITDMLNRIRNAQAVSKKTVAIPFSNLKYKIAEILEKQGFIENISKKGRKTKKILEITLKYQSFIKDGKQQINPAVSGLKRVSKPGQRIYSQVKKIKRVQGGYGLAIVSTSKGLMTDKEARKKKLGGEVLCEIW